MGQLQSLIEREAAAGRESLIFGLVTAKVTAINEDGACELSYLSMGDDEPSAPARVMMPMAGRGRGFHFLPEPGDEVVVAFEAGDVSLPIIIGAVWNDDDPPPDQARPTPDNNVRTIVTRSGHELTFDDTPGGEKIVLRTKGGHELTLDDTVPSSVTLKSAGGGEVEISDAAGALTIRAPLSITLESPSVAIRANLGLQVTAPAGIRLTTTGVVAASAVIIDGKPFGLHTHTPPVAPVPPPGSTGPVTP